jgi:predicted transcriptional regulator
MEDCCLTIREIADEVGISRDSVNMILTEDLGM